MSNNIPFKFTDRDNQYSRSVREDLKDKKHLKAFEALKASIQDIWRTEFEDDFYIFKWLKARQFDARKAERMLRAHLQWRADMRIDYLLEEFQTPEVIKRYYTGGFCGKDKQGRPVWYDPVGLADPEGMAKSATKEALIKSRIYICEFVNNVLLPLYRQETDLPVYQITVVYDFEHFSRRHMWGPAMDLFSELTKLCEANYPESMGAVYVINAPALFTIAYNLLKPLLHPETQKKVHILGSNYRQGLLEDIEADDLPAAYGGNKTDPDGNPRCKTWICYGGDVPEKYFLQPVHRMEDITVGRKSQFKKRVHINHRNSFIEWEFSTDESDIAIEVLYTDSVRNEEVSIYQKKVFDSHMVPCSGYIQCAEPGDYIIKFDNSNSWVRSKRLHYHVSVVKDEPDASKQNYEAQHQSSHEKPTIPWYVLEAERSLHPEACNGEGTISHMEAHSMSNGNRRDQQAAWGDLTSLDSVTSYYTAVSTTSEEIHLE